MPDVFSLKEATYREILYIPELVLLIFFLELWRIISGWLLILTVKSLQSKPL